MSKDVPVRTLDELPLFASDEEIAVAVVGPDRAAEFLTRMLPTLELDGFPKKDPFYGGRAVSLVKAFYEAKVGLRFAPPERVAVQDGPEDPSAWTRGSRRQGSR